MDRPHPNIAAASGEKSAASSLRRYHGACACGSVRFSVRADASTATRCICRKCRGMGLYSVLVTRDVFRLLTGEDALTESLHDALTPHHFFCGRCGEAAFGYPQGVDGAVVTVNLALLERGDLSVLSQEIGG